MPDKPPETTQSRLRRAESRREPATIDLSATEVSTESPTDAHSGGTPVETSGTQDASSAAPGAIGSSEADVRPTPDEVIPSDDARVSSGEGLSSTAAESETSASPGFPSEPRRGFGFSSLVAAGVVGGLLGTGAAMLSETLWRPRSSQVDARLAQLEGRAATTPQAGPNPLEGRIAKLEADNKALADRLNAAQALAERSAKEVQEALKRAPAAPAPGADAAALGDLATRLGALEKQLQERAQAATSVQERVASVQERAQAAVSETQALERRLADQDQRLAAVAKQVSERRPDAMAASLRVTLADRLDDTLRDGAPVGGILALLRRLNVNPEAIRPLEPYAQNGPPNAAALAQEFRPLGQRMIAQTRPPADDWGERLTRMFDKIVTVRSLGEPGDASVPGLVARIEQALGRGAYQDAVAAWDALPEAARGVAPEWGAKLKQRAAADAAARTIHADALSAIDSLKEF